MQKAYLNRIMAHLKHDQILHPQVLLDEVHPLCPLDILERVVVLAIQLVHDVPLEVFQKIDLVLHLLGVLGYSVGLADVNGPIPAGRDIVEVATGWLKTVSTVEQTNNERKTYCLSGANAIDVLSLKCTPTVPSVNAYPIPYLLQ